MGNLTTQSINSATKYKPSEIPKNIHFVWLGNLGTIQQNYINAWQQTNPDYQIKVWYDPQALLVYELNKQIKRTAHEGQLLNNDSNFERIIELQNDAYQKITNGIEKQHKTFDQAAIEFMSNELGCTKQNLEQIRQKNQSSYIDFEQQHSNLVQLFDINLLDNNIGGKKYYYQELALRQNLAAASDIVRINALYQQGGIYVDVDFLPAFKDDLFSDEVNKEIDRLSHLVNGSDKVVVNFVKTQLVLEQLQQDFPTRHSLLQNKSYTDYVSQYRNESAEHALLVDRMVMNIRQRGKMVSDFFQPLAEMQLLPESISLANMKGFSNAVILSSVNNPALKKTLEQFAENYQYLENAGLIHVLNIEDIYKKASQYINEYAERNKSSVEQGYHDFSYNKSFQYRLDGIQAESNATMFVTGPIALHHALDRFKVDSIRHDNNHSPIFDLQFTQFNQYTEEETKHSWLADPNQKKANLLPKLSKACKPIIKRIIQNPMFTKLNHLWEEMHNMVGSQQIEQIFKLRGQVHHTISELQTTHHVDAINSLEDLQLLNQEIDQVLFNQQVASNAEIIQLAQQHPEQAARLYQAAFNEGQLQENDSDFLNHSTLKNSLQSAIQHPEWFNAKDKHILRDLFLDHFTTEQLLELPESLLSGINAQQAERFLLQWLPNTLDDHQFLSYLKSHSETYNLLSTANANSPLLSRYSHFSVEQRMQVPPETLLSLHNDHITHFFNGLSDKYFIEYIKQNRTSYAQLIQHLKVNPLLARVDNLSLSSRQQVPPEGLILMTSPQIEAFFSIFSESDVLSYTKQNIESYANWVKQRGDNPLLSRLLNLPITQLIDVPSEVIEKITFKQATEFFVKLDSHSLTSEYFEQHYSGLATLNRQTLSTLLISATDNQSRKHLLTAMKTSLVAADRGDNRLGTFVFNNLLGNAIQHKDIQFVELLIKHAQTDLQPEVIFSRIEQPEKIAIIDSSLTIHDNPLLLAIKTKQLNIVKLLLNSQSLSGREGFEWLSTAIHNRDHDILKLLLQANVDPNSRSKKVGEYSLKQTALTEAVESGDISLVNTLLEYGARDSGEALKSAINSHNIELVERLSSVDLYSHLTNKEKVKLYKQALQDAQFKQALFKQRHENSTDISARFLFRKAFNNVKAIENVINQHGRSLRKQIQPIRYKLQSALAFQQTSSIDGELKEAAAYHEKKIVDWDEPTLHSSRKKREDHSDNQLIIQLEDDSVVKEAVARLVGKHPENTVLVQLNTQGEMIYGYFNAKGTWIEGSPSGFNLQEIQRWQIVGHGRSSENAELRTLGGRTVAALTKQLSELNQRVAMCSSPKHIDLVGCSLADIDLKESYLHQFALSLSQHDILPSSISAYSANVMVNKKHQKRLTEIGEKVILSQENGNWVMTSKIPGKNIQIASESPLLMSLNNGLDFELGMKQLYLQNKLSDAEWLPVFQSLKEVDTQSKQYNLQFIHKDNPDLSKSITVNDSRIFNFIHEYDSHLSLLKNHLNLAKHQQTTHLGHSTDAESIHGLNTAFIIQTLFNQHIHDQVVDGVLPEHLRNALQVHTYANWMQMGWDGIEDAIKYVGLWKTLATKNQATGGVFKIASRVSPYVGIGLNILSTSLDGYELANAQNEAQRAVFGTQLAFDLVNLANAGISVGASAFGAPVVASFAGSLGVPIAGLGIGITALVQGTQVHIEKTKAVGRYFGELDEGYQKGGYQIVEVQGADGTAHRMWKNRSGIAIQTLDLRHQKLTFADTWIYKTYLYGLGSGYSNHTTWVPPVSVNRAGKHKEAAPKQKVINIREGINHHDATVSLEISNDIPLILPDTPQYYMDYSYETFPFVTARNDCGFDILRRLESNYRDSGDNFSFDFYNFPSERAISELKFEYVATPINILLGDIPRTIIMPALTKEMKGKIAYTLVGGNSTYHVSLQEGAALTLAQGSQDTHWIVNTRSLIDGNKQLQFGSHGQLKIGQFPISFSNDFQGTLSLINDDGLFSIDVQEQLITLEKHSVNAAKFNNYQSLHEHLKQISHSDTLNEPFISVQGYQTSEGLLVGLAFYETARDRFIFTNVSDKAEFLSGTRFAKVENDQAWLYRDDRAWVVDIPTGRVMREYLPLSPSIHQSAIKAIAGCVVSSVTPSKSQLIAGDDGVRYFSVEYQYDSGPVSYIWQLTRDRQQLVSITGAETDLQQILLMVNDNNSSTSFPLLSAEQNILAGRAEDIHLFGRHQDGMHYHSWYTKPSQNLGYEVSLRMNMANTSEDIQPVPITIGDKTRYYFYSAQQKKLYFQENAGIVPDKDIIAHEVKSDVYALSVFRNQLTVQGKDGMQWLAGDHGRLLLMGVMGNWLLKHQQTLMADLALLATDAATLPAIHLQGMYDSDGKAILAWYDVVAKKVIQASDGINTSHDIHYRGLSADGDQAWLYDSVEKQLYRQLVKQDDQLAFSELGQNVSVIPLAERWSLDHYLSVTSVDDDKLQLITAEGAILLLDKTAKMGSLPQLIGWQKTVLKSEQQVISAIENLQDKVTFAPTIRLFSKQEQTPAWYLTAQKNIVHARGLNEHHDLRYLGQTDDKNTHYIHDQTTGQLWQTNMAGTMQNIGQYRLVAINEDKPFKGELILQHASSHQEPEFNLPRLADIDRLIVSGRTDNEQYRLDDALFSHYQQIIIDEQGKQPTVQLPHSDNLLVRMNGQDLVWYDPKSGSQLLIAYIEQAAERGMVFNLMNSSVLSAKSLLNGLVDLQNVSAAQDDWFTLSLTNGYYQLQGVDQEQTPLNYRVIIGAGGVDNYQFTQGDGNVIIKDVGGQGTLSFIGIPYHELTFSKAGNNLVIKHQNNEDSLTIQDAFLPTSNLQIEKIITSDSVELDTGLLYQAMNELFAGETLVSRPDGALAVQDSQGRVSQLPINNHLIWKGDGVEKIENKPINYRLIKSNEQLLLLADQANPLIVFDRLPVNEDTIARGKLIHGARKHNNVISIANAHGLLGKTIINSGDCDDILHIAGGDAQLLGGKGNDLYRVSGSAHHSVIQDGGGEQDALSLEYAGIRPDSVILQREGENLQIAVADSGLVTIKNQFKQGKQTAIEQLTLINEQQNWHYSLIDMMSSLQNGGVFALSKNSFITQADDRVFSVDAGFIFHNVDPK